MNHSEFRTQYNAAKEELGLPGTGGGGGGFMISSVTVEQAKPATETPLQRASAELGIAHMKP